MRVFTRFLLVVLAAKFDLLAFENKKKYRAYVRFHENGPYGKIPTKKEPIRTLGFTSRLSCHIIMVLARVLNKISMTWTSGLICSKLHISYYWWISSSKCSPIGYYSSPLIFSDSYWFKLITWRDSIHPRTLSAHSARQREYPDW